MREGYARVSENSCWSAGKLKKMRCRCNTKSTPDLYNTKNRKVISYFNLGETGFPFDKCPKCNSYIWHTVNKGEERKV